MPKGRGEYAHGKYLIRTLAIGGQVKARAFLGARPVADAEAPTVEQALSQMRSRLDARDMEQSALRIDGIPSSDEFVDAFTRLDRQIGAHHRKMLRAMFNAPDHILTATGLAASAGYSSHASANEKFGKLARMIAEDLDYQPPCRPDGTPIWTMTLATGADAGEGDNDGMWRWKMRPEVVECLRRLNADRLAR
jgi:hypothetical protein